MVGRTVYLGRVAALALLTTVICGASAASAQALSIPQLYWADHGSTGHTTGAIGAQNIDASGPAGPIVDGISLPSRVAVNGQYIYWTSDDGTIGRASLADPAHTTSKAFIRTGGSGFNLGLAINDHYVYWLASDTGNIGRANIDGSGSPNPAFVVGDPNAGSQGLAVDGRYLYWANRANGTIGRANLDGSGTPNQSFITGANNPIDVAVDGQHIYWSNPGTRTIGVANLDGSNPNPSFITVPPNLEGINPIGLAVDAQHIFWANGLAGTVGEANLDGTNVQNAMFTRAGGATSDVALSVPVLTLGRAPAPFATTPQGTLSAPQTLTLTNTGQVPLMLGGLSFSGPSAGDFILDWSGCLGSVAPGQSCQFGVSFAPQSQGTRSATLQIFSNDYANSPMQVPLSGTGGALPQGPVGPAGPAGLQGSAGAPGSPGQIELVTCKTVTLKQRHRRVRDQKCTGRLVSGRVSFATAGTQASLVRGQILYARGARLAMAAGYSELVLGRLRGLHRGKYTLILRQRNGRHWATTRQSVTID